MSINSAVHTATSGKLTRRCLSQTHQSVGKDSGETNHVERWNNTLRQRLARFVRKTLAFSKSEVYHKAALKLYLHYYNTERRPIS